MAIIQTVTFSQFCDSFRHAGRSGQFSYKGLRVLFDFLEDFSDGSDYELDVVGLCCSYYEMNVDEIRDCYSQAATIDDDDELMDWLTDNTLVCGKTSDGDIVFAQF